ncbi:MAG: hypothetical protein ACTSPB_08470 [Candidatus Thorarchaeota archaeon]
MDVIHGVINENGEFRTDRQILDDALANANKLLQDALRELDFQLKESAATLFGHKRKPKYKERCYANAKALDNAHDEIAKAKKDLFHFKMKHGE